VLREKIHHVLREYPDVGVYVIGTGDGDFLEAIRTLQQQGKHVILWATRRSINQVYGESLRGPDRIQIEWLEDLVFGDAAAD
jgi:DNA-binding NarL/FixJ family response regulator